MEDIKNLTNDELIQTISNISTNHEKIKGELLVLHELLNNLENDYLELTNELKTRR